MEINIQINSEKQITELAEKNIGEIMQLPKELLTKENTEYYNQTALDILAEKGNPELIKFPQYLLENPRLLLRYAESITDSAVEKKLKDIVGIDNFHKYLKGERDEYSLLHVYGDKGDLDILKNPESFKQLNGCYDLPVFDLFRNVSAEDLPELLRHPCCLQYYGDMKYFDLEDNHTYTKYPMYYLERNRGNRPTVSYLKKYFKIKTHYRGNKLFNRGVLKDMLKTPHSLNMIFSG